MNAVYTTPHSFVKLIHSIVSAYNLNLQAQRLYLRLVKEDEENLTIQKLGNNILKVVQYQAGSTPNLPSSDVEFLIEYFETDESNVLTESWTPLRVTQGFEHRQIAWINSDGDLIDFDSAATSELVSFCLDWEYLLIEQQWHIDGKPAPNVTVTTRYIHEPITEVANCHNTPIIHLAPDYSITGNRVGLLSLINAIATTLSGESSLDTEVFNSSGEKHQLKVSVCQ